MRITVTEKYVELSSIKNFPLVSLESSVPSCLKFPDWKNTQKTITLFYKLTTESNESLAVFACPVETNDDNVVCLQTIAKEVFVNNLNR